MATTLLIESRTEWRSETPVQIAARRLDDGTVEFGLRQRQGAEWGEIVLPDQRLLAPDAEVDEWKLSDEIAVTGTHVTVQLRDGVYAGDYLDEFDVFIDGQAYRSNCGDLRLEIVSDTVLFNTKAQDCGEWIGLATVCGVGEDDCDTQRAMSYLWERAQRDKYGFEDIEVSIDEAAQIAAALFRDYWGPLAAPPAVETRSRSSTSTYSSGTHTIYLSRWGRDLDTVMHETTHAIILAGEVGGGHDRHYAAQILHLWDRYAPIIDTEAVRVAAADFNVEVAATAPVAAQTSHAVDVIHDLICTEPVRSQSYCDALAGVMRTPAEAPSVEGPFQPLVRHGSIDARSAYSTGTYDDGGLWSQVHRESNVDEYLDLTARLHIVCGNELSVRVYWEIDPGFSNLQWRIGDGEFARLTYTTGSGWRAFGGVRREYQIAFVRNSADLFKEMVVAASAGQDVTFRIRSGVDVHTSTFSLDGLFDTPLQPNLVRCGTY